MTARVEFTNEESAVIYDMALDGRSSRDIADRLLQRFAKRVSHTTILSLVREMCAEEQEMQDATRLTDAPPPGSDLAHLAEAILKARQLRARTEGKRAGTIEYIRETRRLLELEIRTLRFKMALIAKAAANEDAANGAEPPADATLPTPIFPAIAEGGIATEVPQTKGESDPSKHPSKDASNDPSSAPLVNPFVASPNPGQPISAPPKQGPNERCACGSGMKFKRCCGGPNAGTGTPARAA